MSDNIIEIVNNDYVLEIEDTSYTLDVNSLIPVADYQVLQNKPQINSVTLSGNKTSSALGLASANDLIPKENISNKVTTISSSSTDTQYPSAKSVYDNLELKENLSNKVTSISSSSTDTQYPSAKSVYDNLELKENLSNKTTTLTSSSTDIQYPGAKTVFDKLELKENLSNKVTSISSSSTDTQYPSAKSIYDNLELKSNKNFDNLSVVANDKLLSLKSYFNGSNSKSDVNAYNDILSYEKSAFDISKFTVVGSPIITNDGIASGFSNSNYVNFTGLNLSTANTWEIVLPYYEISNGTGYWNPQYFIRWLTYTSADIGINAQMYKRGVRWLVSKEVDGAVVIKSFEKIDFDSGTVLRTKLKYDNGYYTMFTQIEGQDWVQQGDAIEFENIIDLSAIPFKFVGFQSPYNYQGSFDLKQFSITVDGKPVFSGNKTGIDTIKANDYTVVGSPAITDDGIASGFSNSNYVRSNFALSNLSGKSWKIEQEFWYDKDLEATMPSTGAYGVRIALSNSYRSYGFMGTATNNKLMAWITTLKDDDSFNYYYYYPNVIITTSGYVYESLEFNYTSGAYTMFFRFTDGTEKSIVYTPPYTRKELVSIINYPTQTLQFGYATSDGLAYSSIDLNKIKVYVEGNLVYQPCLKIPYTQSKTGSKIVDSYYNNRVQDMYAQFGWANYYVLDKSNKNYILPMGENLDGHVTKIDWYNSGFTSWEYDTNLDCIETGSCTSGTAVTLPKAFADTNYSISVPYSSKTKTGFTPTQTGDYIAKGKVVLG